MARIAYLLRYGRTINKPRWLTVASICGGLAVALGATPWLRDELMRRDGYSVVIEGPVKAVSLEHGKSVELSFRLRNLVSRDVQIQGAESNCGCFHTSDLPFTVPAKGSRSVVFAVNGRGLRPGQRAERRARLFLEVESPPLILGADVLLRN